MRKTMVRSLRRFLSIPSQAWLPFTLSALVVALAGSFSGCGQNDPASVMGGSDLSASDRSIVNGDTDSAKRVLLLSTSDLVLPTEDEVLVAGKYTLQVPVNALSYTATYSVTEVASANTVQLSPHGAIFNTPVTLVMNLSTAGVPPTATPTLYWYNDSTGVWENVGGTWDRSAQTLTTALAHFSTYRAGW